MSLLILLPGAVCLLLIAALLWFRGRWFNAGARVAVIAALILLGVGFTFYLAYPDLDAADWQAIAAGMGVLVAISTASLSIYQNGQLARSQHELVRFQQAQAENEEARPEILPEPFPFRDSRTVDHKQLQFRVANRGRSPTAVETVRLRQLIRRDANEYWHDSEPAKVWPAEEWPGKGGMTIPGGTIRTFVLSGKSFKSDEAKRWLEGRTIFLEVETVTGHRDTILLGQKIRIGPPEDEEMNGWIEHMQQEEEERGHKEGRGPWWQRGPP